MDKITLFEGPIPQIGLKIRKPTKGPEWELVQNFVDYKVSSFNKRIHNLAIFIEPMLDTGFPDLVLVEYDAKSFDNWTDSRLSLQINDLKIFQHILHTGGTNSETIETQLGLESKYVLRSVEKLLDCGIIRRYARKWKVVNFRQNFGVRKIAAIEAKLNNWGTVFEQAQLNKWFSSESYVLSPVSRPSDRILSQSEKLGIGIYSLNSKGVKKIMASKVEPFPSCYGSLLFNEWIGRRLRISEG